MTLAPTLQLILYCVAIAGFSLVGGLLPLGCAGPFAEASPPGAEGLDGLPFAVMSEDELPAPTMLDSAPESETDLHLEAASEEAETS